MPLDSFIHLHGLEISLLKIPHRFFQDLEENFFYSCRGNTLYIAFEMF